MGNNCSNCNCNLAEELANEIKDMTAASRGQNSINDFGTVESFKNLNFIIKLQRAVKSFLKRKNKLKSTKPKHRPNQSSIKLKSNRVSINNLYNSQSDLRYTIDPKEIKYVENYRIENAIYTGEMAKGMRHGKGVQIWDDGAKYDGDWRFDKAHGMGTFYHTDGDIYQGMWLCDRANGDGTYINNDGATYQGKWKDDLQEGYGVEVWVDGSSFRGYYRSGKKEGFGTYIWADKSKYEGNWSDNKLNGNVFRYILFS